MAIKRELGYAAGGAALGLPIGAAISYLRRKYDESRDTYKRQTSPSRSSDFPLIPGVGPRAKHKSKEKTPEKKGGALDLLRKPGVASGLAGAAGGSLIGHAGANKVLSIQEAKKLDEELANREAMLDKLLIQEQMNAAGSKTAECKQVDEAIEVLASTLYDKVGMSKEGVLGSLMDAGKALNEIMKGMLRTTGGVFDENRAKSMLLAAAGAGAVGGAGVGYSRASAADPNRAREKNLQNSLETRLKGDPEGPAAPIVLKLNPERLGVSTVPGTESALTNPTANRDILANL